MLLWFLLGMTAWAAVSQFSSPILPILAKRSDAAIHITLLTEPAMFVAYNPAGQSATVRVLKEKRNQKNLYERAQKILQAEGIPSTHLKFFAPNSPNRELFWENLKHQLASWRFNPLIVPPIIWSYVTAWHEKRTNLSPSEFLLLLLELTRLEASDFTVQLPAKKEKRRTPKSFEQEIVPITDMAPLTLKNRPIIVEVLNASGKRGLALELTQYLRAQNEKGQLRVDVLQYDNYPTQQETSWLENYTGKLMQVKQLSQTLGINGEIKVGTTPNVICDTRIIIGKDFKMPL